MRYIYNHLYFSIPFTAMQLKLILGDRATFWDCLILAHNVEDYNEYYSLIRHDQGVVLPNKKNTPQIIIQKLRENNLGMNQVWNYQSSGVTRSGLKELIKTQNVEGLAKLLNK